MSEITKLYENAGIEKEVIKGCYEYYSENGGIDIYTVNDCKNKDCNTCKADKSIKEYPPFTAEKQIKLIEFFISSIWWENLKILYKTLDCSLSFEDKLAKIVNYLWYSLSEEEKQQVKGILE